MHEYAKDEVFSINYEDIRQVMGKKKAHKILRTIKNNKIISITAILALIITIGDILLIISFFKILGTIY